MNITQIQQLRQKNAAAPSAPDRQMVETHISWVLLDDVFAYKIKKPVKFSFLDFSTLEQRIFYCNRELELNKRYSPAVYLEVVPVRMQNGELFLAEGIGKIVDVAVKMRRLDSTKEMDKMLARNEVTPDHIRQLAR